MSNIVAIRSLQCPDHAYNIPPTVLTVNWNITKRCNYDCSYCSPFIHDAVSPFITMDLVYALIHSCEQWCSNNQQIKWAITGGEPFINPNFIKVLELLHKQSFTYQINVISNGSLPIKTYLEAAKFVKGITFSLHFERSDVELEKTIATIIEVKKQTDILISVNIMFMTGTIDKIKSIIAKFKEHQISYIVRLITPIDTNAIEFKPYIINGNTRKDVKLKTVDEQRRNRQQFYNKNQNQAITNIQNYYSNNELDQVKILNNTPEWTNAGVWFDNNSYQEINTDQLISKFQTGFKNWICYAGVDSIYIDWDGTIYKGMCLNDGPIGHINNSNFVKQTTTSTICMSDRCQCNIDIATRKAIGPDYLKLITK